MANSRRTALHTAASSVGRFAALAVGYATTAHAQDPPVDYGPDVLVITTPVLTAFEKGLRTEIALRDALRQELAARRTKAQHEQCVQQLMTSPENQPFNEALLAIVTSGARPEVQQPRLRRLTAAIEARNQSACGADPGYSNDRWTAEQLGLIERRAAAAAFPIP
jgi:hypothetical protein